MSTKPRWHLGHLGSLRGIAVLLVVMVHSTGWAGAALPMRSWELETAHTSQRGVSLFFIASALTLFLSYDNRRDERRPTRDFFVRRFFRLAPMFTHIRSLKSAVIPMTAISAACYLLSRFLAARFPIRAELFTFFSASVQLPVFLFGIVAYFIWNDFIAPSPFSD